MTRLSVLLVALGGLLMVACGTSVGAPPGQASGGPVDPNGAYCQAVQTVVISQPALAVGDQDVQASLDFYADSVERLAELSSSAEAVVLFELASTARLIGTDPADSGHAARLNSLITPVGALTLRASQACGFAG